MKWTGPEMPKAVVRDWQDLQAMLAMFHPDAIPCRSGRLVPRSWWTSNDPAERAVAAEACQVCPALRPCAAYGVKHPKEAQAGVYGGRT